MKRIVWLDAVKGFGILLVMLSHAIDVGEMGTYLFSSFIPLFFIASGCITKSEPTCTFIKKKTRRLLIPYFFYGVLSVLFFDVIKTGAGYRGGMVSEWIGLLYSRFCFLPFGSDNNIYFLPMEADATLWFLTSMLIAFAAYSLIEKIGRNWLKGLIIAVYVALTVCMSMLPILLPWSIDTAFIFALFIYIGKVINGQDLLMSTKNAGWVVIVLCILLYIALTCYNGFSNISVREYGRHGLVSIVIFFVNGILFFKFSSWIFKCLENTWLTKAFAFVGRQSLRLLCIQMPIIFVVNKSFDHYVSFIYNHIGGGMTRTFLALTVCIATSTVVGVALKRIESKVIIARYL